MAARWLMVVAKDLPTVGGLGFDSRGLHRLLTPKLNMVPCGTS